jgi:tripartite-type tricarboxylate transporter receptor subunit TctC
MNPIRRSTMRLLWCALSAGTALGSALPAAAQPPPYPSRPVKLIVPYAPGGATDVVMRLVGKELNARFGQPFVVENRPGAGGHLGMQSAMNAPADGYTLVLSADTLVCLGQRVVGNPTYDPRAGLRPVAFLATNLMGIAVHPSVPATTLAELIDYVTKNPGKINYATPGIGTPQHIFGALFVKRTRLDMSHIAYKGGAAAVVDLLSGQVPVMVGGLAPLLAHAEQNRIRILATTGEKRVEMLPDVPTVSETVAGLAMMAWIGLFARPDAPPDAMAALNAEINEALKRPENRALLLKQGLEPRYGRIAEVATAVDADCKIWNKAVDETGIALN